VVLQSAIKFVNLTVPGSTGRIAFSVRFLQRMGTPTAQAIGSGAVDGISETLIQIVLVLAVPPVLPIPAPTSPLAGPRPSGRLILGVLIALAVVIVLVLAIPAWRQKVLPPVRNALTALWQVAKTRRKRLELFGGNVASEVLFALCLGACALAYGVDLSLP